MFEDGQTSNTSLEAQIYLADKAKLDRIEMVRFQ